MKLKHTILLALTFVFCFSLYGQNAIFPDGVSAFPFPRFTGSGGPHVTQDDGFYTIFTNPALFAYLERQWHVADIGINRKFDSGNASFSTVVFGPLTFGFTTENVAFGILNTTRAFSSKKALETKSTNKTTSFGEQLFLTGGYGAKVYETEEHTIALGLQMQAGFLVDAYDESKTPKMENEIFNETLGLSKSSKIDFLTGLGFDFGFLYDYNNFVRLGLTIRDLTFSFITPYNDYAAFKGASNGSVDFNSKSLVPNISLGLSISPNLPVHYTTFTRYECWLEFVDMIHAFKSQPNAAYNLILGMEFEFNSAYTLRLGFKELFPTFGVGIDLGYFEVDGSFSLVQADQKTYGGFGLNIGVSFSSKI